MINPLFNEKIITDRLTEIINDNAAIRFALVHFHLTNHTASFYKNHIYNLLEIDFVRSLEELINYVSFMELGLQHIINQLPVTIILLEEGQSIKAYSTVENTKENLIKVIEIYKEKLIVKE